MQEEQSNSIENKNSVEWYGYNSMEVMSKISKQNKDKYQEFKERIGQFEDIATLEEAKALSQKILPVANEENKFSVGNAVCVIINKPDMFRISLDSAEEFISYDFV